jgi:adenylylsulfate kinase-like enzyme
MIIVLFGQPNSGKTTLAKQFPSCKNIDGDELRELFSNKDYSREGRIRNLNRASDIAHYLHRHGNNVTLSLVYPYKETRDYLRSLEPETKFVYLTYELDRGREQFHVEDFEYPDKDEALYLNTEWLTEEECIKQIYEYVGEKSTR